MVMAMAMGARKKVLHSYPIGKLRALGIWPADRLPAQRGIHDVEQNLRLLSLLGIAAAGIEPPGFPLTQEDRARGRKLLDAVGIDPVQRPIAIHPGSAKTILAQAKRWPPERYGELIGELQQRGHPVVVLEGPDEIGVGQEVAANVSRGPVAVLTLRGPLAETAAVLEQCRLYVGSDSGLAHLAAAVGTPPVTLFAPADPDRVCPFGFRHLVVQPARSCCPCFMYPWEATYPRMKCAEPMCIREISVASVSATADRALCGIAPGVQAAASTPSSSPTLLDPSYGHAN
jgi:ADP-heptose:LPS heptosyltransferase